MVDYKVNYYWDGELQFRETWMIGPGIKYVKKRFSKLGKAATDKAQLTMDRIIKEIKADSWLVVPNKYIAINCLIFFGIFALMILGLAIVKSIELLGGLLFIAGFVLLCAGNYVQMYFCSAGKKSSIDKVRIYFRENKPRWTQELKEHQYSMSWKLSETSLTRRTKRRGQTIEQEVNAPSASITFEYQGNLAQQGNSRQMVMNNSHYQQGVMNRSQYQQPVMHPQPMMYSQQGAFSYQPQIAMNNSQFQQGVPMGYQQNLQGQKMIMSYQG